MKTIKAFLELVILAILPIAIVLMCIFIASYVAGIGWRLGG